MRKNHRGNIVVVHFQVSSIVENAFDEHPTSFDGHGRECHLIGDIADGIDTGYSCVLELIDLDCAADHFDACVCQAERFDIRRSAHGYEASITLDGLACLQVDV